MGAVPRRGASRAVAGVFEDRGGQQSHEDTVGIKLGVAGTYERLGCQGAAVLDLTDVLQRVADPSRKAGERQLVLEAQLS
jgi:hypothetical protein